MGAIVVAICVGLLAIVLVALLIAFAAVALMGLKGLISVHEGGSRLVSRFRRWTR
jgi:hypothetical protein